MMANIDPWRFCLDGVSHYAIDKPWRDGEYVYATNGQILIRVLAKDHPTATAPDGHVPSNVETLLDLVPTATSWREVPACVYCRQCRGEGTMRIICDHCGEATDVVCFACEITIEDESFAQHYMNMIRPLPGVEIALVVYPFEEETKALAFKFTGGIGLLMPRCEV